MSVTELRLWEDILGEHFGPIVSKVGVQLVRRGRQPLAFIVRETGLEPGQVRDALVVLIQHRLVWHYTSIEGTRPVTYYQTRPGMLYHQLRFGTILYCATQWFDQEGFNIIRTILLHGMMTLPQAIRKIAGTRPKLERKVAITKAFTNLVGNRFLVAVQPQDTQIKFDRDMMEDEQRLSKMDALPTAKQLAEVQQERLNREEEERLSENITGLKRKLADDFDDYMAPEAKASINHYLSHRRVPGDDVAGEVDESIYFAINFERFLIRQRNQQIVRYFSDRINRAAASVISTLLALVEPHIRSLNDKRSVSKTVMQIGHFLQDNIDLSEGIMFEDRFSDRKRHKNELIEELLSIMQQDTSGIVVRTDTRGGGEFAIAFDKVNQMQRQRAIESVVLERFGNAARRILRLLQMRGKMDEKQISKLVLLPLKDTRTVLHTLLQNGFVELQEVPKTADRAPSRTFFLWHVVTDRTYTTLLKNALTTLANIRQRARLEREKRSALIIKSTRLDVKENPNLLSEAEHNMLRELKAILNRLGQAEMRLVQLITQLQTTH